MSSKIEQIIDEIEEYIDNCKPHNFSSSKIVVNRDEIDELLTELRMKTPEAVSYTHLDVYKRQPDQELCSRYGISPKSL